MKIIRIIFLILLALGLIASMGVFILFQTFDTDQYLSQISKKASLALGRQVSIGHMGLGLSSRGITLDAGPVTIADDPAFTSQPFININMVRVSLDLNALILKRQIHITNILLQSPEIHFIRNQDGNFNVRSIGQTSPFAIDNIVVKSPNGNVVASQYSGDVFARSAPQKSGAGATKQSFSSNITIQDAAISFIDQNQTFPVDIWLTNIDASLNNFSLSKPFGLSLDAMLYSNSPNVHLNAVLSLGRSLSVSNLRLGIDFSQLDLDGIKGISPEMSASPILNNISGVLQINLAQLGIDASENMTANGDINITGGVIKNLNIIKTVLSHTLGVFGGMEGNIDNLFNGQLKDKLDEENTVIEKARVQFSIHDKSVFIDDSLIQTDLFEFIAKGSVDQELNTDMETTLHLNEDVSAALVNELGGLKFLMDDSKRITIGASLKGVIPHLKYKPNKDFRKKSKRFLIEEGGSILNALFR